MKSIFTGNSSMLRIMTGIGLVLTAGHAIATESRHSYRMSNPNEGGDTSDEITPEEQDRSSVTPQAGRLTYNLGKVCSAITPSDWRDSMVVPDGWTSTTCAQWAESIAAAQYQLGYVTSTGYSWCTSTCW